MSNAPVAAQDLQQSRRKHDVAVGMPLALLGAQHHALTVDVADLQAGRFRDPQAGGVGRHQDRAVLDATDGFKEARHFIRTENDRELARLLWHHNLFDCQVAFERDVVKKPQRGGGHYKRAARAVGFNQM